MKRAVSFLRFCAVGVIAVLCGCTIPSAEQKLFYRVADELDSGGSYYSIQNPYYLNQALKNLCKDAEEQIWELPLPQEKRERFQLFLSAAELFYRTSGIAEIEGLGASSRYIGKLQFKNTFFLALPAAPQGVLWQLLPQENVLTLSDLENLPENTTVAGAVMLNPQALTQRGASLYPELKLMIDSPLFKELKGVWRFAAIIEPDYNAQTGRGVHLMIALPDPQKKVFTQLADLLQIIPKVKIDRKKRSLAMASVPGKAMQPCGVQKEQTLYLFTSPQAEKLFMNADKTLKTRKDFQRASLFAPYRYAGVFYSQSSDRFCSVKDAPQLRCGFDETNSIAVMERSRRGLKWSVFAPWDWNVCSLQSLLVPASFLIEPLLLTTEPQAPVAAPQVPETVKAPVDAKPCLAQIKQLWCAIMLYCDKHGRFPEKPGIAGLREVQPYFKKPLCCPNAKHAQTAGELSYANCDYLYFGNPSKGAASIPLLMERPGLHDDNHLIVAFADGHVLKFDMEKTFSVRKAISFLHTKYHYEENEFLRLMDLAAEFDKLLER